MQFYRDLTLSRVENALCAEANLFAVTHPDSFSSDWIINIKTRAALVLVCKVPLPKTLARGPKFAILTWINLNTCSEEEETLFVTSNGTKHKIVKEQLVSAALPGDHLQIGASL